MASATSDRDESAGIVFVHEGGGEPIDDPDEFLRAELDIDPDEPEGDRDLPEFLQ
jgi:hypothetical protein